MSRSENVEIAKRLIENDESSEKIESSKHPHAKAIKLNKLFVKHGLKGVYAIADGDDLYIMNTSSTNFGK
jgi:hypothetical protein